MTEETTKREGKRIECAACWAHPRTPRLCYCDVPQPPRETSGDRARERQVVMTDPRPSIAELQRATVGDPARNMDLLLAELPHDLSDAGYKDETAAMIAALLEAAPVLLEIAAAAMAYENAKAEAAKARQRYAQDGRDSLLVGVANCDYAETARRAAYVTALSKVRP